MPTIYASRGARPTPLATLYSNAKQRVMRSPRLRDYLSIIMDDGWSGDEDHLRWVIRGKVGEIELWARQIKRGCDD
jgi:hypothetical protein